MKSYIISDYGSPLTLAHPDRPQPTGTEVLVKVRNCGICHTDLHVQDGYYDLGGGQKAHLADRGLLPPVTMGHEIYGELVAKGPEAPEDVGTVGRSYVVYPWVGCGACNMCLTGQDTLCAKPGAIGIARPGGYGEYCLVPHPRYLVDAEGIPPEQAAIYACSGLTAYSALKKCDLSDKSQPLLILGAGGVGLSALQIARAQGHTNVHVADIDPAKRELALGRGAVETLDSSDPDAIAEFLTRTGGMAAVIDFVGSEATSRTGLSLVRKAGTYIVVGLFGGLLSTPLPGMVQRSLTLRGSFVGTLAELRELIDLARSTDFAALPTEMVEPDAINSALDRLRKGGVSGRFVISHDAG